MKRQNPNPNRKTLQDGRDSLYLEYYLGFELVESKNGNLTKSQSENRAPKSLLVAIPDKSEGAKRVNTHALLMHSNSRQSIDFQYLTFKLWQEI